MEWLHFCVLFFFYTFGTVHSMHFENTTHHPNSTECPSKHFPCDTPTKCIPFHQYCDGYRHCDNGNDEVEGCTPLIIDDICGTGQFRCKKSRRCIPMGWMCDGEEDCGRAITGMDSSDEEDCHMNVQCHWNHARCGTLPDCRPLSVFCDGRRDCPNDADEYDFCQNKTMCESMKCSHDCKPTMEGPKCYCLDGFKPQGTICVDADECQLGPCQQLCTNTEGSFTCSCVSGYKQENNRCKGINVPNNEPASVLYSTLNTIERLTDGANVSKLNLLNSHGLEFSHRNRTFYYIHHNLTESMLVAVNVDNFTERWTLPKPTVFSNLDNIQQIALDWLSGNWYLLDDEQEIILLCNNTLTWCRPIIEAQLNKAKAIALNPMIGFMFFTKWGLSPPVIERCRMDGTQRMVLVERKIVYPYGVTVDYSTNDIYWLDTYLDVIEKIDYDGRNRRTIVKGASVQNLYGIAIFENYLYVTSWKENGVMKIDREKLSTEVIRSGISRPFYIHVFHRQRQPDVAHPCRQNNGNCSHICVTNWNKYIATPKCLCAAGFTLQHNGECTVQNAPVSLVIAKAKPASIQAVEIETGNDTIIPISGIHPYAIDVNMNDKVIYYSETDSPSIFSIGLNATNKTEVLKNWSGSKCVALAYDWMGGNLYWADQISDISTISVMKLTNTSKKRILIFDDMYPSDLVLNPKKGVMYWIDMMPSTPANGSIETAWMDGSHKEPFVNTGIQWPTGLTIDLVGKRLYWSDASFKRIESIDFNKSNRRVVVENINAAIRIAFHNRNLFYIDALENSLVSYNIETNSSSRLGLLNAPVYQLKIYNSKGQTGSNNCSITECKEICLVIPKSTICMCPDGYNLVNFSCIKWPVPQCKAGQFRCKSNSRCIPDRLICDGKDDCPDGSDESVAKGGPCGEKLCNEGEYSCDNKTNCVSVHWMCDGDKDCEDGMDEDPINCPGQCSSDQFRCAITKRCISNVWKCDGVMDCGPADNSDEKDCGLPKCDITEFTCNNSQCIPAELYCDGFEECSDGSDEINCSECRSPESRCNGYNDCPDGSDEEGCTDFKVPCDETDFPCGNSECIPKIFVCDSLEDCSDGSDEHNCKDIKPKNTTIPTTTPTTSPTCEHPSRTCDNGSTCVSVHQLCDDHYDCKDQSDEGMRCLDKQCTISSICSHICHNAPEGVVCSCPEGLHLQPDKVTCSTTHPCEAWGVCSQKCVAFGSRYKCECLDGYSLTDDGFTCKSVSNATPYVIFSNRHELRGVDLHSFSVRSLISSLKNTIALDFFHSNDGDTIFWTDVIDDKIYKGTLVGTLLSNIEVVVQTGLATAEGLAVDWIGENLYWVESNLDQIEVAKLNGSFRRTLVGGEMESPRAIALDPRKGYLFWSDWDNSAPRIERCSLAGLDRTIIIRVDHITDGAWPNGLTLDYDAERIYWIDARSDSIHTADYDGLEHHEVMRNHDMLSHPFAITLYENYVYWTDWRSNSVVRANKWTGGDVFVIQRTLSQPFDIQILHPSRQPRDGPNPCGTNNGGCSHLCLLHTNHTYRCDCPHVMRLQADNKTCVVNDRVLLIARVHEIRGVDLLQPYYHTIPTISIPQVMSASQLEYLAKNNTIYWTDSILNEIKRSGLTTGPTQTIIDTGLQHATGLALDWIAGLLYIGSASGIIVCNLEGEYTASIVKDTEVVSVAIDPTRGKLFWVSLNSSKAAIETSLMDGTKREVLVGDLSRNTACLTVDLNYYYSNRLYWISAFEVWYYDFEKRNASKLNLPNATVTALTTYKNSIYYANDDDHSIHSADKLTGANDTILRNSSGVLSLRIYDPAEQAGQGPCDAKKLGCQHLCIPISPLEGRCVCATGYSQDPNDAKKCIGVPEFVFYSHSYEITGLKLNSSNEETLGTLSRISMASAIDYLAKEDLLFWADSEHGLITSIGRDGTRRKVVVDQHEGIDSTAADIITGLAVDWSAGNIYWIDPRRSVIQVSRLNGSSKYVVLSQDIGRPKSIAVDPSAGMLVWGGGSRLDVATLDGANRRTLLNKSQSISDVTLDTKFQYIYFCDSDGNTIERIKYDGTDRSILLNHSLQNPVGLTLWNDMLYWIQSPHGQGSIKMGPVSNLSDFTTVTKNIDTLKDIQVFSRKRQLGTNACAKKNAGCQHLCLFNGTHPVCACPHGKLAADGKSCEEYDSFIMFSKVLSIDSIHMKENIIQNAPYPPIKNSTFMKNAIGLAFNYQQKRLFYSDIQRGSINTVFFNGTEHKIIVERLGSVPGLVYEHLHNALYWTCSSDAAISRVNLTASGSNASKVEVVIKLRNEDKPRGIAVDSCGSRLYWTNWNSHEPAIERAYLSGYDRKTIINSDIRMPNGITLDHKAQKLYWSDARLDKIERCEYDGSKRVVLAKVTPQHPFALAVYGDYIYWTDWVLHAVLRADKLTGQNVMWLRKDVEKPMGIIAIANDTNDCFKNPCLEINGGCEGVCNLTPSGDVECSCPDGHTLAEDGKRCFANRVSNCTGDSFRCSDGGCVPFELTCDSIVHCTDGSDEEPGYCGHRICPQGWFSCINRRCILQANHCNGIDECGDFSDELECNCSETTNFRCGSGECIPKNFTCDKDPDCRDASDEMNCEPRNCTREYNDDSFINCASTTICIHKEWICDGENDCLDMSDEVNCTKKVGSVCKPHEFQCIRSGKCISFLKLCDKVDDCNDGHDGLSSDEEVCSSGCSPLQFKCANDSVCLPATVECNGFKDCADGSDEAFCTYHCHSDQFQCQSGECIPVMWQCDGQADCNDSSDESFHCQHRECSSFEFRCRKSGQCISKQWVCDHQPDCHDDGEDELDCDEHCDVDEFQCADGSCIPNVSYCDGEPDCGDKSDEPEHCIEPCGVGQFKCVQGGCIPQSQVCDKKKDCIDGSDESKACDKALSFNYCKDQFVCNNGVCVNNTLLCNGDDNCGDYSDEKLCNINECADNPSPCMHNCTDKLVGYECSCLPGYKLSTEKPGKCEDIDECDERPCSQTCKNVPGSYHCSCNSDYFLRANKKSCSAITAVSPKIILANRYYIRQVDLTGHSTLLVHNLTNAVALDYDWKTKCFFWSDVTSTGSKIKKLCGNVTNGTTSTLHGPTLQNPDGLAVDWVAGNIYWCDKGLDTIEVSTVEGKYRRVLISALEDQKVLEEPRAIALHPKKGVMFWSDWGSHVHIGKAGMDGSNARTIVSNKLGWPNALTIDYETDELFWADAREDYIAVSDLNGENIRIVTSRAMKSDLRLHHVFAITVWEDFLYWSDWETKSVERCHKYYGNMTESLLTTVHRPMDLRIYHPFRQPPKENPCEKANCSALCLLSPEPPYYKCACPENYILGDDQKSCKSNCTSAHFECVSTYKCIPFWWKCDTQKDCDDGSDEPDDCPKFNCKPGQVQCDNAKCIHPSELCNGKDDCGDLTDERNCQNYTCLNTQFRCKGNSTVPPRCISITDRCNKIADCPLGEDEEDCQPITCASNNYQCKSDQCVPLVWVCDGEPDCNDGSDEFPECATRSCPPNHYKCSSGRCIPTSWQCDGDEDCLDGGDEPESCRIADYHTCESTYFKCNNGKCIPGRWHCDYDNDCSDGSDEIDCVPRNCSESEFKCKNGKCVAGTQRCDGQYQCEDRSDEENCNTKCGDNEFQCADPKLCIYVNWRCDGEIDCADASDELNCTKPCPHNGFKCDNGLCINEQWVCDGQDDCGNGYDETSELCANHTCLPHYYRCSNHVCIPWNLVCNGINNCNDSSDEVPLLCHTGNVCRIHQFKCASGHCIDKSLVCDGENDCLDSSDERDCKKEKGCQWNTCSQLCIEEGSQEESHRKNHTICKCSADYKHSSDGGCTAIGAQATLILAVEAELQLMSPYKSGAPNQLFHKSVLTTIPRYKVGSIDTFFSPSQVIVFWTNPENKQVQSMELLMNSNKQISRNLKILTVLTTLTEPRGIAVDWITEKLYITQTDRILVSSFNGLQSYTLIAENIKQPRDIVVSPDDGFVFWADWGPVAVIECSDMDGKNRRVLVRDNIIWPTGLAIDYPTKRLYWSDPKSQMIGCVNFNGTEIHYTHKFSSDVKPFKIEVFEDFLYLTTYRTHNVYRYDKFGRGNGTHLALGLARSYDIHIMQEHRQDYNITNRCRDLCHSSELCLLNSKGGQCTCPDGFIKTNSTCQPIPQPCGLNCNTGTCKLIEGEGPRCICPPKYTGPLCEYYRCSRYCHNKGMCYIDYLSMSATDAEPKLRCNCPPQYTGERCETPVPLCKDRCYNGGTCYNTRPGGYQCSCRPGFSGPKCQNCARLMCNNGGICTKDDSGKEVCQCPRGYEGETCDIFLCDNYCGKNGSCTVSQNGPVCHCNPGHTGTRCEKDACAQTCLNGGVCVMGVKQLECKCPPQFTGRRCQIDRCLEHNPPPGCTSCPCQNGATCIMIQDRVKCNCKPEWTGKHCEIYIYANDTRCENLCQNGGECMISKQLNEPYCSCRKPFEGDRCEKSTAKCLPECLNGGVCDINADGTYCRCPENYDGTSCENVQLTEPESSQSSNVASLVVTISLIVILTVTFVVGGLCFLYRKTRPFLHERLNENDFNNPMYQERDAEPFTLDTDRSNNFVNPVYETVYNGTTGVKEEKTGLLQTTSEEAAALPSEEA